MELDHMGQFIDTYDGIFSKFKIGAIVPIPGLYDMNASRDGECWQRETGKYLVATQ